jgi:hypothetical protein
MWHAIRRLGFDKTANVNYKYYSGTLNAAAFLKPMSADMA